MDNVIAVEREGDVRLRATPAPSGKIATYRHYETGVRAQNLTVI